MTKLQLVKAIYGGKKDLSGADLTGADLKGADFTGALWVDGVTLCKKGSIGKCLAQEQ